jgi:hypothetical protein
MDRLGWRENFQQINLLSNISILALLNLPVCHLLEVGSGSGRDNKDHSQSSIRSDSSKETSWDGLCAARRLPM